MPNLTNVISLYTDLDKQMQDDDYKWFLNHLRELYQQYGDRYLAIKNHRVLGVYDTYAEGVHRTMERERLGTFIIQECGESIDSLAEYIF